MLFKVSPPPGLLQLWGTSKSASQVLSVQQFCSSGTSASLITGHIHLHKHWRRTRCSTPDSFCTTTTEYWAKTASTTIFSSPFIAVYSFILPQLSDGSGFFCSLYATMSSYAFCYNYWLPWANKTSWCGLNVIPDDISATFPVLLNIFHPTLCC